MLSPLPDAWYDGSLWPRLLTPLSWMFGVVSWLRRFYLCRFRQQPNPVPVIVVGNISVGGTGKTPLVIWLCEQLLAQGWKVGVVSRGYGGQAPYYPYPIDGDSSASVVGDEPLLIHRRTGVPVVVGADRVAAIDLLTANNAVDLVISDDGLQHYRMARDIEIAVIDGQRQLGNGRWLPAGPLRESEARLAEVEFVVQNGATAPPGSSRFVMTLQPDLAQSVNRTQGGKTVADLGPLDLAAGIGNPQRFFSLVRELGGNVCSETALPDHCALDQTVLNRLLAVDRRLLITEKDAVKLPADVSDNIWFLPVSARMPEAFLAKLLDKLNGFKTNHAKR